MYSIFSSFASSTRSIAFKLAVLGMLSVVMLVGCSIPGITAQSASTAKSNQASVVSKQHVTVKDSQPDQQGPPQGPPAVGGGCGQAPVVPAGMSENKSMIVGGLKRTYRLHVPEGYRDSARYPLVINFHGHSSTMAIQEHITQFSTLANQDGFVVAYPQGTIGQDLRTGWNTGPWNYPHVNDIGFTGDLVTYLESSLCINPQRIYAVGFSNGGGFTNVLACKLSGEFAAFAIVSGGMHPVQGGCDPRNPVSLLEVHGTYDHVVPYTGDPTNDEEPNIEQWAQSWAQRDSCTRSPKVFYQHDGVQGETWLGCRDGATVVHYRIQGGEHMWPSAHARDGLNLHPLDTTAVVWQFLYAHTLDTTQSTGPQKL